MDASTLIAGAALLVAAISAGIAARNLREARKSNAVSAEISARHVEEAQKANALSATVEFFREYRSEQMVADRRLVLATVRKLENSDRGVTDLPNDTARAAIRLSHYLDHRALLVATDLFPAEMAPGFLGVTAVQLWEGLRPFIETERERRPGRLYLEHFEHLAVTL